MPIIAYQSFNANSSSNHHTLALASQPLTRSTDGNMRKRGHEVLEYPQDPNNLNSPIEGPAFKRRIVTVEKKRYTSTVFGNHISQVWQHFQRELGGMPNIMVIGELDSSHSDFKQIVKGTDLLVEAFPQKKACQSFSAISQSETGSLISQVATGIGYVAYSVSGLNVVFVHVPNDFATNASKVEVFYQQIAEEFKSGGKIIHLVMGDTNQKSLDFTARALNGAFKTTTYKTAASKAELVDTYPLLKTGTNSTGKEMYDVAVYRSDLVEMEKAVYISQSPTGITVTDHCGLGVVVKPKTTI